jgi:lipid-A-disaccharide synthase
MKPKEFMIVAGESSGDILAAELATALRKELANVQACPTNDLQPLHGSLEPRFFGAGGPRMAAAGVELAFDLTAHAVVGLVEVLKDYGHFRRLFHQLLQLAIRRQPDAIVCVDFSGFNRRFAAAVKGYVRARSSPFLNWNPKIIQYVSPQVWASREGRAEQMARDLDLLLSIFPFEKEWYAKRFPNLNVEFVGHPIIDRHASHHLPSAICHLPSSSLLLLPGSRAGELKRHLPVMLEALARIQREKPQLRSRMVLPNDSLVKQARGLVGAQSSLEIQTDGMAESLAQADLAIASTGTVTMECAYFGVPTVAIYKTSWATYQVAKRMAKVGFLAMPNLLAGDTIYPEFIQDRARPENIAREALDLLDNEARRHEIRAKLAKVIASLGGPGASERAAKAIVELLVKPTGHRQTRSRELAAALV